jgi:hypothetical protein
MTNPSDRDTFFSRQDESLSLEGGRFALANGKPRLVGSHLDPYATEQSTPLTAPDPTHGFVPDRDVVEEPTSDRYGIDLNKLPGAPPAESTCPVSSQPPDGDVEPSVPSPSSFRLRRI